MPYARVRGIMVKYEIFGDSGPWVALSTGGRNPYAEFVSVANKIAAGGFRVVLHDRRNCGASDVALDDSQGEDEHRVDDLHELLVQLDALPAFVGGSSSGCRMSLLYYLRHPALVRGLLLLRVTGGAHPAKQLPENYYDQFIRAAAQEGMEAVCAMDHWRTCIEARPENRTKLMSISADRFIAIMSHWRDIFMQGVDMPVIGISEEQLRSISVPTIVIPGNDKIHSAETGRLAHRLIPNSEIHQLPLADSEAELVPFADWAPHEDEIAQTFIHFMKNAMSPSKAEAKVGAKSAKRHRTKPLAR